MSALRSVAPYVIGLVGAAALYVSASSIDYTPRPGTLGPDFWPKLAVGLLAAACMWEIARRLLYASAETKGLAEVLEEQDGETETPAPTYPWLLAGGIALIVAYAVLVPYLGFLLASFLFLAAFMYLGRYRNHLVIWSVSAGITLVGALVFMRFAYVSLPRGVQPFDRFTDFIRLLIGG